MKIIKKSRRKNNQDGNNDFPSYGLEIETLVFDQVKYELRRRGVGFLAALNEGSLPLISRK